LSFAVALLAFDVFCFQYRPRDWLERTSPIWPVLCRVGHTHTHTHTHTHNRFRALWILSRTTWVSRYQKKHLPTHTYRGHQSSIIGFIRLLRSVASSLFYPCTWQSFSTVCPSFLWSTSWPGTLHSILHTFLLCVDWHV